MKLAYAIFLSLPYFCLAISDEMAEQIENDLAQFNATCDSDKHCIFSPSAGIDCDCESFCARLGTCCPSSGYLRVPAPQIKPSCRLLSEDVGGLSSGVWMIDRCPQIEESRSAYDELCRQEDNDLIRLVPVTSLYSHLTYKNIFCYLCHESNGDYAMWNVELEYDDGSDVEHGRSNVRILYDEDKQTWVAPLGEDGKYITVLLRYQEPDFLSSVPRYCNPSVISDCAQDWRDDDVRMKCNAYAQEVMFRKDDRFLVYRNHHCAVCNHEDLKNRECLPLVGGGFGGAAGKRPFSFTFLLDINRSDGDKVGKIQRCSSNQVWDPFFEKCRNLKCAIPGYIVRDGKCGKA